MEMVSSEVMLAAEKESFELHSASTRMVSLSVFSAGLTSGSVVDRVVNGVPLTASLLRLSPHTDATVQLYSVFSLRLGTIIRLGTIMSEVNFSAFSMMFSPPAAGVRMISYPLAGTFSGSCQERFTEAAPGTALSAVGSSQEGVASWIVKIPILGLGRIHL